MLKQDIKMTKQNKDDINPYLVQQRIKALTRQCKRDLRNLESVDINDPFGASFNYQKSNFEHCNDLTDDEISILAQAKDWKITSDINNQRA